MARGRYYRHGRGGTELLRGWKTSAFEAPGILRKAERKKSQTSGPKSMPIFKKKANFEQEKIKSK